MQSTFDEQDNPVTDNQDMCDVLINYWEAKAASCDYNSDFVERVLNPLFVGSLLFNGFLPSIFFVALCLLINALRRGLMVFLTLPCFVLFLDCMFCMPAIGNGL